MPKALIQYFDRTNQPKTALAGSDIDGNTVTGHTPFDIDGQPVNVATAANQTAMITALGNPTDLVSPAPAENATIIGVLKGIYNALTTLSLKASGALIGRVTLADAGGVNHSINNPLRVRDDASGPSDDCIVVQIGTDYSNLYPQGLILRARVEGTLDVTTKSGNRRVLHFAACETRPVRVLKVWSSSDTTASGIEGMV